MNNLHSHHHLEQLLEAKRGKCRKGFIAIVDLRKLLFVSPF